METIGISAFRVMAVVVVFLGIYLLMGHRQIGELSPLDFIISITAGAVAGSTIVDSRIELPGALVALVLLGIIQILFSWFSLKFRSIHRNLNFNPIVVVENGQVIKKNLHKLRLNVETLIQLLREKDVFAVSEVELAMMEPQGKLSVLKKPEYQPLTPNHLNMKNPPANEVFIPIVIEGELQLRGLQRMGFSAAQIEEFRDHYQNELQNIFIAFMDKNRGVHIVREDVAESQILH